MSVRLLELPPVEFHTCVAGDKNEEEIVHAGGVRYGGRERFPRLVAAHGVKAQRGDEGALGAVKMDLDLTTGFRGADRGAERFRTGAEINALHFDRGTVASGINAQPALPVGGRFDVLAPADGFRFGAAERIECADLRGADVIPPHPFRN